MTDYYRAVRCDYLEDTSLSIEAFRILGYMLAQKQGFEFNLDHLKRVFRGQIGHNRLKAARAELISAGYLIPGQKRHSGGRLRQDGATVAWDRAVFAQVDRRSGYSAVSNRAVSNRTDITNKKELRTNEPGRAVARPGESSSFVTPPPNFLAAASERSSRDERDPSLSYKEQGNTRYKHDDVESALDCEICKQAINDIHWGKISGLKPLDVARHHKNRTFPGAA